MAKVNYKKRVAQLVDMTSYKGNEKVFEFIYYLLIRTVKNS